jgi:hypothetical protein
MITGESIVNVKDLGAIEVKNVIGKHIQLWNGTSWVSGDIVYFDKKQKCIIKFTNGQRFICDPTSRFKVCSDTYLEYKDINPCWEKDIKESDLGGCFVRCMHLKKGMCIDINLDTTKYCIEDFDNRFVEVDCVSYDFDDSGDYYTYKSTLECVQIESIEITDDYIDMYSINNIEFAYYAVNGIICK